MEVGELREAVRGRRTVDRDDSSLQHLSASPTRGWTAIDCDTRGGADRARGAHTNLPPQARSYTFTTPSEGDRAALWSALSGEISR